jgi:HK97 family phage prohead protease
MDNLLRKSGNIRAVGEERTFTFTLSDNSIDSYNTVLPVSEWDLERFNSNGVIFYQHAGYNSVDPDIVIGVGRAYVEGEELIGEITLETEDVNPLAEKIFKKIKAGTLKAVSVGFSAKSGEWGREETGDEDVFYFRGLELLEVSIVNIPSNKNALKRFIEEHKQDPSQTEEPKDTAENEIKADEVEDTAEDIVKDGVEDTSEDTPEPDKEETRDNTLDEYDTFLINLTKSFLR